jgi:hypothetical protein
VQLVSLVIGVLVIWGIFSLVKRAGFTTYDRLVKNGIPARGILLQVAPSGVRAGTRTRPFEQRQVFIDIEIPGQPPYAINASPIIPLNLVRDVLPGATVELRLDRRNPATMAIIGPGVGFVQSSVMTAS